MVCTRNEDTFVNELGLVVDDSKRYVVDRLWEHSQIHKKFLHVTCRLALHKCFWTLIKWVWEDGKLSIENVT